MKLAFNSNQRNFVSIAKNLRVGTSLDVSFAYIFPISNASQSQNNLDGDPDDNTDLSEDPQQGIILILKLHIILIVR